MGHGRRRQGLLTLAGAPLTSDELIFPYPHIC
jgi:hypothetical protein